MSKGIKISKDGKNLRTATASDLVMDSDKPGSWKILKTVTLTIVSTYNGSGVVQQQTSVAHGLNYTPIIFGVVHASNELSAAGNPVYYKLPFFQTSLRSLKVWADGLSVYASAVTLEAVTYSFNITICRENLLGAQVKPTSAKSV